MRRGNAQCSAAALVTTSHQQCETRDVVALSLPTLHVYRFVDERQLNSLMRTLEIRRLLATRLETRDSVTVASRRAPKVGA